MCFPARLVHYDIEVGMNKNLFIYILLLGLAAGCGQGSETASRSVAAPDESFAALDEYGTWMYVDGLGRVWQPAVPYEWRPFADGQWVWTDRGWMWLSDEPFSWIVYHYGYWSRWGAAGWLWVPGYEWSPARVRWYSGDDFIGWAPLPPPGWSSPQAYEQENIWVVVPTNQFTRENVGRYRTSAQRPILAPTKDQQRAPDIGFIQRATNQEVRRWRTESEDIRRGERTLTRVRVREEAPPRPTPPPAQVTPPAPATPPAQVTPLPPAAKPTPGTTQGGVRRSGTTRAPSTTRATPATPKTPPSTKEAQPRKTQPPATRGGVNVTPQKPDTTGRRAPQREGRR
jgi:hypothetical protein